MNRSKKINDKPVRTATGLEQVTIGIESEFTLFVDDELVKPEDIFGDPRAFLSGELMYREGSSYHIPTG